MATKRDEAQKRRAEERRKRRLNASDEPGEAKQDEPSAEEPLDTVKHAAKVAAAAAAVGAAMGAARAMTGNGDDHHEPAPEPPSEPEQPEQPEQPESAQPEQPEPRAEREEPREEPRKEPEQSPSGAGPSEARRVVEAAREHLATLLGKDADSVSGLDRNGDGWIVTVEVVEVPRIPESTDVLASYEVELDDDRNLRRYARVRRYIRSQSDREGQ